MSPDKDYLALKNVLFGRENQLLQELRDIVSRHDSQIGSPDRLEESVSSIIAGALRSAGLKSHDELAGAIAPVMIAGMRREIRNSRNEMVDALYPIVGRLASAYVMSVFRAFIEETNRRIEGNLSGRYLRLRIKSLLTGVPYAQLLLKEGRVFRMEEILLIEADRGILLERWRLPDPNAKEEDTNDDNLRVSGMLAAINRFSAEALKARDEALRSIDLGHSQLYLRSTAKHLFAVRCTGPANQAILKILDKAVLSFLETYEASLHSADSATAPYRRRQALLSLAERLEESLALRRKKPVFAMGLFAFIGAVLFGWIAWAHWQQLELDRIRHMAMQTINSVPDVAGYPVSVEVDPGAKRLALIGLVPSEAARLQLEQELRPRIPAHLTVENGLLPVADPKKVAQLERATTRLLAIAQEIEGLKRSLTEKADISRLATVEGGLSQQATALVNLRQELSSPERRLRDFLRTNAIFFSDGAAFRDPALAERQLAELKALLLATNWRLRVIGFTDPSGAAESNDQLALNRAKAVADALQKLGVPSERLAVVGRAKEALLSNDKGPSSSNRRVEFQLVFPQEAP